MLELCIGYLTLFGLIKMVDYITSRKPKKKPPKIPKWVRDGERRAF